MMPAMMRMKLQSCCRWTTTMLTTTMVSIVSAEIDGLRRAGDGRPPMTGSIVAETSLIVAAIDGRGQCQWQC
jgi:hypothetical protein